MTKDEMVGWHHRLNGHKFGVPCSSPGDLPNPGIEPGSLAL